MRTRISTRWCDRVETAGLATTVAKLEARFVIKDGDKADD